MGTIKIDKVEDKAIGGIEAQARLQGKSFEDRVRAILALDAVLSRSERLKLIDEIRAMTPKGVRQTGRRMRTFGSFPHPEVRA